MEGLPRQGTSQSDGIDQRRVYAPLLATRSAHWLCPHPALWLIGQSWPSAATGTMSCLVASERTSGVPVCWPDARQPDDLSFVMPHLSMAPASKRATNSGFCSVTKMTASVTRVQVGRSQSRSSCEVYAEGLCQQEPRQLATQKGKQLRLQRAVKRGCNPHRPRVRPTVIAAESSATSSLRGSVFGG